MIVGVSRKKDNPGIFVPMDLCVSRHEALAKEMGAVTTELETIKNALVGSDLQGGLVKKINDMDGNLKLVKENLKGKLSGRDKAIIIGAVITAIASFAASLVALLKG